MEIKTLSSALVLSLLAVGPAAMAMEEGQDEKSKAPLVQLAPTQDIDQQVQSPAVAPQNVVATPEEESSWSIWNPFSWTKKTPTVSAQEKEVINTAVTSPVPSTPAEEAVSTPAVVAQEPKIEPTSELTPAAPESAVEKEEVSTSAPASTPQSVISAQDKKALTWLEWFFGKNEESSTPPVLATEKTQTTTDGEDSPKETSVPIVPESDSSSVDTKVPSSLTESIMGLSKELLELIQDPVAQEKAKALQARLREVKDAGSTSQN